MNRSRKVVFVCCGIVEEKSVSNTIEASSSEEALQKFEETNKVKAESCHGPFVTKKVIQKEKYTSVAFSGENKNAIYDDWYVKALFTNEPHNCAYLLFDKRVDGKQAQKPQGTFIVKRDYLKEIK